MLLDRTRVNVKPGGKDEDGTFSSSLEHTFPAQKTSEDESTVHPEVVGRVYSRWLPSTNTGFDL
jgi:hypothetical protein